MTIGTYACACGGEGESKRVGLRSKIQDVQSQKKNIAPKSRHMRVQVKTCQGVV
jgi:hypothetical protein